MESLKRVLLTTTFSKESVNIFGKHLRKEDMDENLLMLVNDESNALSLKLE